MADSNEDENVKAGGGQSESPTTKVLLLEERMKNLENELEKLRDERSVSRGRVKQEPPRRERTLMPTRTPRAPATHCNTTNLVVGSWCDNSITAGSDISLGDEEECFTPNSDIVSGSEFRALKLKFDLMEKAQEELKLHVEQNRRVPPPERTILSRNVSSRRIVSALTLGETPDGTDLEEDTFSLMMTTKFLSKSWSLGFIAFLFQMTLGIMIAFDQFKMSTNSSIFNVPIQVDNVVIVGQFLSLILCLATQVDILVSIRSFILLGEKSNWDEIIGEPGNRSPMLWYTRIALPNVFKLSQGLMVTIVSFVIIVQADNIIDLLKDFTALMIISEVDNILFQFASHGYLGDEIQNEISKMGEMSIGLSASAIHNDGVRRRGIRNVRLVFFLLLSMMFAPWGIILYRQKRGSYFMVKFPKCANYTELALNEFGDGVCYGGPLNTLACQFEDSDCVNFNLAFPLCKGENLRNVENEVGNGRCNPAFAFSECDFDGGDCCPYDIIRDPKFGDGQCNGGKIGTRECGFDKGDCNAFKREFPNCPLEKLSKFAESSEIILGNGICEGVMYAMDSCGLEYRDCDFGQLGQDIIFRGVSSGSALEYSSRMSADGKKVMIGMHMTDGNEMYNLTSLGRARIFGFESDIKKWIKLGGDLEGDSQGEQFGVSLAMNFDGSRIVVGAPAYRNYAGKVKVFQFDRRQNDWVQMGQNLEGLSKGWSMKGQALDITNDGSKIAISSPPVFRYDNDDSFVQNAGKIQIFALNPSGTLWEKVGHDIYGQKKNDLIGYIFLKLNSSGSRVYFSSGHPSFPATTAIRVYEYENSAQKWNKLGTDIPNPHTHIAQRPALNGDGTRIAIASYTALTSSHHGLVKVFDLDSSNNNAEWKQVGITITSKEMKEADGFGYNIDMSADGNLLAIAKLNPSCVGSPEWCRTGSIQIYKYSPNSPPHLLFSPVPFKTDGDFGNTMQESKRDLDGNVFGWGMSLSEDGSRISISGYDFASNYGFAKVYEVNDLFYPNCIVPDPDKIGNGVCEEQEPYYTAECSFDGGDCNEPTPLTDNQKREKFPKCKVMNPERVGDGQCNDYLPVNSEECGYDGGDCPEPRPIEGYPNCIVSLPYYIADGECRDRPPYNGIDCGFDGGDCVPDEFKFTPTFPPSSAPSQFPTVKNVTVD